MNAIPQTQNADSQIKLLRARQHVYGVASKIVVLQFALTVVLPMLSAIAGFLYPDLRPAAAAIAMSVTIIDAAFLDRWQRQKLKVAAKICEAFDEAVLQLPWNPLVAGKRLDFEIIAEASSAWSRRKSDDKLVNWYPVIVGKAPMHLARIVCQRTNLWYDATLRRHYGAWVRALGVGLIVILVLIGVVVRLKLDGFVTVVLAPAAPIIVWSMREYFRQKDTADSQDTLKSDAEALWARAKTGACAEDECLAQSREFQNAIYTRRASSSLIMPFLYPRRRPVMEENMNLGAAELLKEIGIEP